MNKYISKPKEELKGRLVTYAAAAGAMVLYASPTQGEFIFLDEYSGIRNLVFDTPGILNPIDLNDDGIPDFNIGLAWSSTYFNSWTSYRSAFIQDAMLYNSWIGSTYHVYQLIMSSTVSSGRTWTDSVGNYYNLGFYPFGQNFLGSGNALLGIRFISNYAPLTGNYGWMRVNIESTGKEFIVVDWAYSGTPLAPVMAGVLPDNLIPPEPYLSADIMGAVLTNFPVEVHFTEPVVNFTFDDISVNGGIPVPGSLSTVDNQNFEVTIHPEIEGTIEIKIPGSVCQDDDGNLNMPGANWLYIDYIDVPKPILATGAEEPVNSDFEVAIEFSEPVTGLEEGDFVITNGTLNAGSLTTLDEAHYSIMVTPGATGEVLIDLPSDVVQDYDLNGNIPAETLAVLADFDSPRTSLYTNAAEPVSGVFPVFIEFTEIVQGLAEYEVDITNGFVGAGSLSTADNITFSIDVIPDESGDVVIQVPAGVAYDLDSYGNLASDFLTVAAELPDNLNVNDLEMIACYPNPSVGVFNLKVPDQFTGSYLEIYNASGVVVFATTVKETLMKIDLSDIPKGVYLIMLRNGTEQMTQIITIE
jgi:hypothetical protein